MPSCFYQPPCLHCLGATRQFHLQQLKHGGALRIETGLKLEFFMAAIHGEMALFS